MTLRANSGRLPLGRAVRAGVCAVVTLSWMTGWAAPAFAQDDSGLTVLRDTEIEETLHADADPVLIAAGVDPKSIQVVLIGSKELNAFAAPKIMAVFTGLIVEADTPNELIGVMAHETGHLAGGHAARSDEMMHAGMKPMILTLGLGLLAMLAGAPDAGAALMANSGYFGTLGLLGYSREQEARADQAAIGFLEKTHQSSKGLVDFFDKFRYQEVFEQAKRFPFFQSHPLSSERIELLRARAEAQPSYNVVDSPDAIARHKIMQAKILGFVSPQAALMKYKENDTGFAARYARSIAYFQMKDPDRALKLIDGLLAENPDNPYLWELKGQVLFDYGRIPEAEAPQRKSVDLKPEAPLLHINLGMTLIALDDPKKLDEGIQQLKLALTREDDNSVAWRFLAQAYDAKGNDGMARLAQAEAYFADGDKAQSREFAMRARERLPQNTPEWRRATDIVLVSDPSKEDRRAAQSPLTFSVGQHP
jgi:predicted Zn-dependent protease